MLKEKGFTLGRTAVVAVEVEDTPGGLHDILDLLSKNEINVEYMYAFVQRDTSNATLIFRFDKVDKAIEVLTANNIRIVPGDRLYK